MPQDRSHPNTLSSYIDKEVVNPSLGKMNSLNDTHSPKSDFPAPAGHHEVTSRRWLNRLSPSLFFSCLKSLSCVHFISSDIGSLQNYITDKNTPYLPTPPILNMIVFSLENTRKTLAKFVHVSGSIFVLGVFTVTNLPDIYRAAPTEKWWWSQRKKKKSSSSQ